MPNTSTVRTEAAIGKTYDSAHGTVHIEGTEKCGVVVRNMDTQAAHARRKIYASASAGNIVGTKFQRFSSSS